jgi:hypothetical protein
MRLALKVATLAVALALCIGLSGPSIAAKNKRAAAEKPTIDDKAGPLLAEACKTLTGLTAYSFQAVVTLDKVFQDGSKIQTDRSMAVTVQRPGSFRIVTDGDEFQAVSVFDGRTFSLALPDRKVYAQLPAVMDTDGLMDLLATQYRIESPLGDLLSNEPCARMTTKVGYYIGKSKVDGVVCDHLFFQGKDVDWQLWIEDGPVRLPRKIIITEKKLRMSPQFTAVLSDWKTGEQATGNFTFDVPEGFTRDDHVILGVKQGK